MYLFFIFFLPIFPSSLVISDSISIHSISPNFTATNLRFVDNSGAFLSSKNGTYRASLLVQYSQPPRVYFAVVHVATNLVIWSANHNNPVSSTAKLDLTVGGLSITDDSNKTVWSTPPFSTPVSALRLIETGNLVLFDEKNVSLWESFDYLTNTIVMGQRFPVGSSLVSTASSGDFSVGNYSLTVTADGAVFRWLGQTYWNLFQQPNVYRDSNKPVSFMEMNRTGLFLYSGDGSSVVMKIALKASNFRVAQLVYDGTFVIRSFTGSDWVQEFVGPSEFCRIPFICGRVGMCLIGRTENDRFCTCPQGFRSDSGESACVPAQSSLSLASASSCNSSGTERNLDFSSVYYVNFGNGVDYFANNFVEPVQRGVSLSLCQDLCTKNCSCLGVFLENSSRSCYLLENNLGSIISNGEKEDQSGYLKAFVVSSDASNPTGKKKHKLSRAALVLIPLSGSFLFITIFVLAILCICKKRLSGTSAVNLRRWNSSSSAELGTVSNFPGLPARFDYEELVSATDNFKTRIGSGGFGIVYKGTMPDETIVAVKKITNLGVRGKKVFCNEIAVIGSIHHVNLVSFKGFCVEGKQRFIVYEYMNKGSLEQILFGNVPLLKWPERFRIALGTAKALAYLHTGCQHRILHLDVKPENILLNDTLQVKVSDFGLSKLLDHEGSKLLTTMRGTRGYLAPEWLTSLGITDKTDVYSFGMVLLEILSGRRNCSLLIQTSDGGIEKSKEDIPLVSSSSCSRPGKSEMFFPSFAVEMHKQGRYLELADPRLEGEVSCEEIEKFVKVALCCVHIVPMIRPTMDNVVAMLEGRMPLAEPRLEALSFLQSF
ncbi:hypothetical protein UlMin_034643 [Ulmus minor]